MAQDAAAENWFALGTAADWRMAGDQDAASSSPLVDQVKKHVVMFGRRPPRSTELGKQLHLVQKSKSAETHRASAADKASWEFDAYVEVKQKETATCNTPSTGGESSEERLHQRPTFQSEAENERRKSQETESFRSFASVVSKNT